MAKTFEESITELEEIVKLVGMDALSAPDRLTLETARSVREDYLHQNAFHETDTYTSLDKQYYMMSALMEYYAKSQTAVKNGADIEKIVALPSRERIGRLKYVAEENVKAEYDDIVAQLIEELDRVSENAEN